MVNCSSLLALRVNSNQQLHDDARDLLLKWIFSLFYHPVENHPVENHPVEIVVGDETR